MALIFMLCLVLVHGVLAADPDPLEDFAGASASNGSVPNTAFTLRDVFKNGDVSSGPGGVRAAVNSRIFPGLQSQGITYVQFRMVPCGINLPHTHPRATEILTLVEGGPLQAGFVDTRGMAHITILCPGDITVFPRGMLHFELNVGDKLAFYISALNSQNPGTLTSAGALFNLPARASATSFNQDLNTWKNLKSASFPYGPQLQMAPPSVCTPGRDITPDM